MLNKFFTILTVLEILLVCYIVFDNNWSPKFINSAQKFIHSAIQSFFSKIEIETLPSQKPEDSFITFLKNHSVFKTFNVSRVYKKKKRVHILVIVSTAPKRRDRRDSIRQTWWKRCVQTKKVFI